MPVLGEQNLKKLTLPSSTKEDPAWVQISQTIRVEAAFKGSEIKDRQEKVLFQMSECIRDWNFTDADGKKAEINPKNILKMDQMDFLYLQDEIDFDAIFSRGLDKLKKNGSLRSYLLKQKTLEEKKLKSQMPR